MKRRREIIIETHVVQVVHGRTPHSAWCHACAATTGMITPEAAAVLARVTARTIYRWVETGALHFTDAPGGALLICLTSLTTAAAVHPSR